MRRVDDGDHGTHRRIAIGEFALPAVLSLAARGQAAVCLVHVRASAVGPPSVGAPPEEDALKEYLENLSRRIRAVQPVEVEAVVLRGTVREAMLEEVRSRQPDLVVMTTHGYGPLSRVWFGSVADWFVRHAPCPVLLIRPEKNADLELTSEPVFHRVLLALDGSQAPEVALESAVRAAELTGAELGLVRIVEVPRIPFVPEGTVVPRAKGPAVDRATVYLEEVAARLSADGVEAGHAVRAHEHAFMGIRAYARQWSADLIVIGTRGRGGPARLLLGSVADKVLRSADVPVMVVPPVRGVGRTSAFLEQ